RRKDEEAKQKALLDSILSSLETATEKTKNLSAEKEGVRDIRTETDIED
ncbi:MAG: hypothetical protein HC897_14340, partial [Thermoanaerobaculia bacterium]|nr:hypothetical protein [Thermoanaerobaculia bacterium]